MNIIYLIRTSLGFSQEYVASQLNITQQNYSRLEKNPDSISVKRLKQLAEIFNVDVHTLIPSHKAYKHLKNSPVDRVFPEVFIQKEIYENQIRDLKSEINFLKDVVRSYTETHK